MPKVKRINFLLKRVYRRPFYILPFIGKILSIWSRTKKKAADGTLHLTLPIGEAKMGGFAAEKTLAKALMAFLKKEKNSLEKK